MIRTQTINQSTGQEKLGVIDTRFRTALKRLDAAGRLMKIRSELSTDLEIGAVMHKYDSDFAMLFEHPKGYDIPVACNFLVSQANVQAVFGLDIAGVRAVMSRALSNPIEPRLVSDGPSQEVIIRRGIDLGSLFPVPHHAPKDAGRFISSGIVVAKDPDTGIRNASVHRLQLIGPDTTGIRLDYGRHLRLIFEKAQKRGLPLEVAIVLGGDLSLLYAAAIMGAQMPFENDEFYAASGLRGEPLELVKCLSVDLEVPAEAEIVLEGEILPDQTVVEGPFIEFLGLYSQTGPAPVVRIKTVTYRKNPIYYTICGRENPILRKYVMEVAILKALKSAVPIVQDVELTHGGLYRFHLVISVRKERPTDEGWQRNAIYTAIGTLKDLDLIIVVDDDIDIRNPIDVEYALATRMEASRDLIFMPGSRGHEYVLVSDRGIRTKLGIDATVPLEEQERFRRAEFAPLDFDRLEISTAPSA